MYSCTQWQRFLAAANVFSLIAGFCLLSVSSMSSLIWTEVCTFLYLAVYFIRNIELPGNVGNAKTAGLESDLGLDNSQWAWVLNSFYICYVLFEWTTVLWKLLPAHIYVCVLCIWYVWTKTSQASILSIQRTKYHLSWGAAAMCAGAVDNTAELIVCRCFLGVFEAAFGAGAPYFLSLFYQRHELGFRVSFLLGMSPVANCFASALAYGITQIKHSIASWRYLFIIGALIGPLFWSQIPFISDTSRGSAHRPVLYCCFLLSPRFPRCS